ncbi:12836_t:CDS:2 [Dentiscutata erythropus]|uniref:12836_t:CDS:1 n=1 Tax=Dentiscutata erythropus TaxID=1348616 RepID=A0A9N9EHD8_9GLOM|nr:12836_t:CDS:2 [Dentiscutata erythropus]
MNLISNSYSESSYNKYYNNLYHPYCTICCNSVEISQSNTLKGTPQPYKSEITRKVRSYVTLACTSCRDRKEKCSGEEICANCKRHNRECVYIKPTKKRGPKPKSDRKPLITPALRRNGPDDTYVLKAMSITIETAKQEICLAEDDDVIFAQIAPYLAWIEFLIGWIHITLREFIGW